jgi:hypothetical protein
MDERPTKRQGPIGWVLRLPRFLIVAIVLAAVAVSPVLYFLSAGPLLWLYTRGMMPREVWVGLVILYEPLNYIGNTYRPFGDLWNAYLDSCERDPTQRRVRPPIP